MEKTGSTSKLFLLLATRHNSEIMYKSSELYINHVKEINDLTRFVAEVGKSKNVSEIINLERTILRFELENYTKNDSTGINSLKEAIKEADAAFNSLDAVNNKNKYKIIYECSSPKDRDKIQGMPKDSCQIFLNSHKTRLGNSIRPTQVSFEDKLLLKERSSNMSIAKNEYLKMQSKTVDKILTEKSKDNQIER